MHNELFRFCELKRFSEHFSENDEEGMAEFMNDFAIAVDGALTGAFEESGLNVADILSPIQFVADFWCQADGIIIKGNC